MKTAKLFKHGRSQAVRLPAEFRFKGKEVLIWCDPVSGDVILRPDNGKFRNWIKLRDRLLPGIPPEERNAFDKLRHGRRGMGAEDVRAKLAELELTEQGMVDAVAAVRKSTR
jgi:antitoxin VapB